MCKISHYTSTSKHKMKFPYIEIILIFHLTLRWPTATKVPLIKFAKSTPNQVSLSHMTCDKNPLWSVDYSQNKCIGFYYSSFFENLHSHSILLCFVFPFTLYSLNFSNVCMGVENYLFIVHAWNAGMSNNNISEVPFCHVHAYTPKFKT